MRQVRLDDSFKSPSYHPELESGPLVTSSVSCLETAAERKRWLFSLLCLLLQRHFPESFSKSLLLIAFAPRQHPFLSHVKGSRGASGLVLPLCVLTLQHGLG